MYKTHYHQSVASTNILARELADTGAAAGTAVVAAMQTKGRGRLGKEWHSTAGKGLYCSIIVRPEVEVEAYPQITLVAGVATATVLDRFTAEASQLKWPNDIYFSGRKCGGILTESSALTLAPSRRYAVVGIGINVNHQTSDFPPELRDTTTSMLLAGGEELVIDEIFQTLRTELLLQLDSFVRDGLATILARWREKDFLLGKTMQCVSVAGEVIEGKSLGPDGSGQLHIKDRSGRIHEVLSGDVRLAARQ